MSPLEVEEFLYSVLDDSSEVGNLLVSYQTIEKLYSETYGLFHRNCLEQVQSIIFVELRDRLFKYNEETDRYDLRSKKSRV